MATKKILFFTAGIGATSAEQLQIDALNALTSPGYSVGVRSAVASGSYGHGIESCDFVAGTIPTAFNAKTNYGEPNALRPVKFALLPATHTLAAVETKQLQALKANGTDVSALTLADVTAVTTTYASSNEAKATVSGGGLVTGVAAGTATITATHTYTTGKTITATTVVTVTA
jgi:uncharacterized protein YjdB